MIKKLLVTILLLTLTFSCSKKEDEKNSAELAYTKAVKLLKDKNYSESAKEFEAIDDEYPFSKWAIKGQVMAIYAHYKNEDPDKVIQGAEDFIRLNSASEYVPYAMYMKGLSYYNRIPAIDRAQDDTQNASFTFRELIARFPQSNYSADAREKLVFVDEHLAGAKMSVGRYQIKNQNYVGALTSFTEVISRYRQTNQVAEAYFRLNEIYQKIGMTDEAKKAMDQLKSKFPGNYWAELANK
jgi:outer membrane protein assembly factor BamD